MNKEELKEEIKRQCDYEGDNRLNIKCHKMLKLIDQLDEPEVIEKEGILKEFQDLMTEYKRLSSIENEIKALSGYELKELVKQLVEPKKPIVPQFVAEWFEDVKTNLEYNLYTLCCQYESGVLSKEFEEWFGNDYNKPIETLIKMKDGYEIEKQPLYHMPLPYQSNSTIYYYKRDDGKISFKQGGMMKDHSKFTQEELDKYFPEVKHMAIEVGDE